MSKEEPNFTGSRRGRPEPHSPEFTFFEKEVLRLLKLILAELVDFNSDDDFKEPPPVASEELQAALELLEESQGIAIGEFLYHVNDPDDEPSESRRRIV